MICFYALMNWKFFLLLNIVTIIQLQKKQMQKYALTILKYFIIIKISTCEVKNNGYFNLDSVNRGRKTIHEVTDISKKIYFFILNQNNWKRHHRYRIKIKAKQCLDIFTPVLNQTYYLQSKLEVKLKTYIEKLLYLLRTYVLLYLTKKLQDSVTPSFRDSVIP